ncbi:MAG TPA: DUF4173 domain-containing protein [Candidatus Mediterraneibacter norfolkensis]|nr:DUF4173 domain-containing protein [Candidatus Mediterraneibacter norfolkensis]
MNENYIEKMRKDHGWFLRMSLIFGIIFVFCIYRNMSGITLPLLTAVMICFSTVFLRRMGITLSKDTVPYGIGIMLLGISTCCTASGFLHFFNYIGIILLFCGAALHQVQDDREWGVLQYVKKFFSLAGMWIISVAEPFRRHEKEENVDKKAGMLKNEKTRAVGVGILAALLFLCVVLPLLMMSDRIFSRFFTDFFSLFDLGEIFDEFNLGNLIGILLTFLIGMTGIYAFFAAVFRMKQEDQEVENRKKADPLTGITFTGILAAVYVFYSAIQIIFLFLRLDSGLPDGMTYSQYAHEGFWQLLFVSVINFAAVVICIQVFGENKILSILLCIVSVCTCVMILSAAYRMMLYVGEYNLTFLRVLVLWFLGVLMVIFFGVIYSIFRRKFRLFRYIMAVVSVMYIGFSLLRPDRIIAEYNISKTESIGYEDVMYLLYGLSEDAAPELLEIDMDSLLETQAFQEVNYYFNEIQARYGDMSLRTWNFSRGSALDTAEMWKETAGINSIAVE